MLLLSYLKKCDFDAQLERFFDYSCTVENWEIEEMKSEYYKNICSLTALNQIDGCDIDYQLDVITTEEYERSKEESKIGNKLDLVLRSFYGLKMSICLLEEFDMIDRFESELFDRLSNFKQKNYNPICFDDWDAEPIQKLKAMNHDLYLRYLHEIAFQLMECNPNIDIIDKAIIIRKYIQNYEPDLDLFEALEMFEENDFKSLINHMNDMQRFLFGIDDGNPSANDFTDSIIIDCVLGD